MTNILHILHTGLILISVITATSCSRFSTKRMMEDMMAKPIVMPKMLLKVNKDSINRCTLPASNSFIIFIDSSECKSCVISGLKKYKKINELSVATTFNFRVIIAPRPNESKEIIHIAQSYFDFPVYLDDNYDFLTINKHIPKRKSFHAFLTDSKGQVIFIGDPLSSERMMKLFHKVLKSIMS